MRIRRTGSWLGTVYPWVRDPFSGKSRIGAYYASELGSLNMTIGHSGRRAAIRF